MSGERPRRGPRSGEDTRGAILEAARAEFARVGYDAASLRGIARVARVDPALVHHYFDGKDDLFTRSVVALSLPQRPHELVDGIVRGARAELGRRAVTVFLSVWEERREVFAALARTLVQSPEVAAGVRGFLAREVFGRVAREVAPECSDEEQELRAGLVAAQMAGLALTRYVLEVPGVADATPEELVERVGPVVQGYLLPR